MHSIFYSIVTILILLCAVLVMRKEFSSPDNKKKNGSGKIEPVSSSEEREDYFGMLMSKITPSYYWRINSEYIDFTHATIKKMRIEELTSQPILFSAQRRCSDLNSAVYKYYDNIKKRCAEGEEVPLTDIEVLNLRQCFNEFSREAYPELVALVWPQYQRPEIDLASI
ncbi:ESA_00282 family adhesion-associated protein [Cedecea sp. FDAARGOS_727]|uniref:ESA_00282 family adhesion-associated protein n=1 Tax=Cedecea TaxID=158483 RepID=UPI00143EE6FB|nr:RNA helicase [Cedecea sp. FDAARGOS_727]QIX96350.1 RNA helicase [Cedecea sp. FDAARGOS_727]